MKPHLKKSLEMIDKYIRETPQDIIDSELESCKSDEFDGPTFDQYLELFYDLNPLNNMSNDIITQETEFHSFSIQSSTIMNNFISSGIFSSELVQIASDPVCLLPSRGFFDDITKINSDKIDFLQSGISSEILFNDTIQYISQFSINMNYPFFLNNENDVEEISVLSGKIIDIENSLPLAA